MRNAFFSKTFPTAEVQRFERDMPEYESVTWRSQTMGRFIDLAKVKSATETGKVVIVSGDEDPLMTRCLMMRLVGEYDGPINKVRGGHNAIKGQY